MSGGPPACTGTYFDLNPLIGKGLPLTLIMNVSLGSNPSIPNSGTCANEDVFRDVILRVFYLLVLTILILVSSAYLFISKLEMGNTRGHIIFYY